MKTKANANPMDSANMAHKNADKNDETRKVNQHKQDVPLVLASAKQRQGQYFEQLACQFLQKKGLTLIAQNWHQPKVGELDLIMLEKGVSWSTLIFIEVRQRRFSSFGDAALSVTTTKQRKLIKTARYFLHQHTKYRDYDCRFDVVAYDINSFSGLPNSDDGIENDYHNKAYQPEWLTGAFVASAW